MASLLDSLNPEQLAAVTLPHQHALVLAGAGSGKTRVLTTRIAWLIQTGSVSPHGIIAVTFTNKAAKEMLTRIAAMLPISTRGMWVGTFHGLCNRLLRAHHREARLPSTFQILDSQDQLALVKRVMKAINVDEDRFPPRQVVSFIAGAKEEGRRPSDVEPYDELSRRGQEIYAAYDEQCQKEGVADFAELLLRCHELLAGNEPLRSHYQARFRHVLVDEFQDTNRLQYRWLKLFAGQGTAIFAVGDDDQCVLEGTQIAMANGSSRAVESVRPGHAVLSGFGTRRFAAATVERVHRRTKRIELIAIRTVGGRRLASTPEHVHFAGYRLGTSPQSYFVYLMQKDGVGFRLGTSQVYTRGQKKPMVGFRQRALQEHTDRLWIVATHETENAARAEETILSLRYGLPTLPFVPRKGKAVNGLVYDADHIRRVFAAVDTEAAAARLMADRHLSLAHPHHAPRSRDSSRRNIAVTLCGDRRGARPMHRIAIGGNDAEGRRALEELGLSVRPAKRGSGSWRYETCRADYGEVLQIARDIRTALGGRLVLKANLAGQSLPYTRAADVRAGMLVVVDGGQLDVVESVERLPRATRTVIDLDVSPTHNYVANGVVTHNSIYAFRGANIGNMEDFRRDYRVENIVRLEQNYRSHGHILRAANNLIGHNRKRLGKNLWTSAGEGEALRVYEAQSDGYEANFVVEEIATLAREGYARRDMAILYRSNAQSRILEHALFSQGIPYRVYGGLRFFERQEVKHALAYLRLIANPDDDGAFLRVVNFPTRGIGARSIEALQDTARGLGSTLWHAATALAGKSAASVGAFVRLIGDMKVATAGLALAETVEHVIEKSGLVGHYRKEKDGADRVENLEELVNAAAAFSADDANAALSAATVATAATVGDGEPAPADPLATFLAHAALESGDNQAGEGADAVQLMTVHSAKGLEFHAVFITGLEEGLFPHESSVAEDDGLEEERRLMYVAITRARTRLYLTFSQTRMLHGQTRYAVASRFIDELPKESLRWITPRIANDVRPGRLDDRAWSAAEPPQRYAARGTDKGLPFRVGQNVIHPKFGQGVIVSAEGSGTEARVQINFGRQGMKWLQLEYAKLTAA